MWMRFFTFEKDHFWCQRCKLAIISIYWAVKFPSVQSLDTFCNVHKILVVTCHMSTVTSWASACYKEGLRMRWSYCKAFRGSGQFRQQLPDLNVSVIMWDGGKLLPDLRFNQQRALRVSLLFLPQTLGHGCNFIPCDDIHFLTQMLK